jgi:hypothetical protein
MSSPVLSSGTSMLVKSFDLKTKLALDSLPVQYGFYLLTDVRNIGKGFCQDFKKVKGSEERSPR